MGERKRKIKQERKREIQRDREGGRLRGKKSDE